MLLFLQSSCKPYLCSVNSIKFRFLFQSNQRLYLSVALQPFVGPWSPMKFLNLFAQSVGFLGRGINPSQGCYLHRTIQTQNKRTHTHPCLEWDSNPRSQRLRWAKTVHALARPLSSSTGRFTVMKFGTHVLERSLYLM
jgi:hypothetical protein